MPEMNNLMEPQKFFAYILYSSTLNKYYIGSTQHLEQRIHEHLASSGGFTGKAKDWQLKYSEAYPSKSEAIKRELQIKRWKSRKMIERLFSI